MKRQDGGTLSSRVRSMQNSGLNLPSNGCTLDSADRPSVGDAYQGDETCESPGYLGQAKERVRVFRHAFLCGPSPTHLLARAPFLAAQNTGGAKQGAGRCAGPAAEPAFGHWQGIDPRSCGLATSTTHESALGVRSRAIVRR